MRNSRNTKKTKKVDRLVTNSVTIGTIEILTGLGLDYIKELQWSGVRIARVPTKMQLEEAFEKLREVVGT